MNNRAELDQVRCPDMNQHFVLRLLSQHLKLVGPITLEDLKSQLRTGRITFTDFIYFPGNQKKWVRIIEVSELLSFLPQEPTKKEFSQFESEIKSLVAELPALAPEEFTRPIQSAPALIPSFKALAKKPEYQTDWYLQFQRTEYGPYHLTEVERIFASGKLHGQGLAWQKKLTNWFKVSSFQELVEHLPAAIAHSDRFVVERGSETRIHRRHSLIASASLQSGEKIITGICMDISKGGLQVIELEANLTRGKTYNLLVHPVSISGIPSFSAQSKLIWTDDESKKMGFQFVNEMEIATIAIYLGKLAGNSNH